MSKEPLNLRQTIRKSTKKSGTGWLAYRTLRNLVETLGRVASVRHGHDVYYQAGSRPLILRRQATNGAAGALVLTSTIFGVAELIDRRSDDEATYGLHNAETSDLVMNIAAYVITVPLAVRELKTGTSLFKKHPTSGYGKLTTIASLIGSTYLAAQSTRELYARRATWLPKVTTDVSTLWFDATYAIRRKMTGEPKIDVERLLSDPRVREMLDSLTEVNTKS